MALEIPLIADLIARPRRIVRFSPAKKAAITAYEAETARAVQSRKLSKLAVAKSNEPEASADIEFDRSALAGIMSRWEYFIASDDERENVVDICFAYLRHEAGSLQKYRELTKIMSERQRRGW